MTAPAPAPRSERAPARGGRVARWGRAVFKGTAFDVVVGLGLVTYGLVYLLVAAIAVRIAVTGRRGADTPYAALDTLAETVAGELLLWVTGFGLAALALWQVFETIWRRNADENPIGKAFGRLGSTLSAAGYLTLAVSAVRVAAVGRATREGRAPAEDTVGALEHWALRVAVVVAAFVLFFLALRSAYRGVRCLFLDDLKDGPPRAVVRLGQGGHVGRGVTYGIIGGLMLVTAVSDRLGPPGWQSVLRLVNLSPTGGILLWLKAAGFALFGVYCFAWAANRRR